MFLFEEGFQPNVSFFFLEKKHLHLVSVTVTMLINMNAFHNCSLFQLNLKHFPRDHMEVSFQDVDRLTGHLSIEFLQVET